MTFDQIVGQVCTDLGITAPDSIDRVGSHVNNRYKNVLSDLGMNDFSRVEVEVTLEGNTREQEYASDDPRIERIVAIYKRVTTSDTGTGSDDNWVALDQLTYNEMKEEVPSEGEPTSWAKKRVGSGSTIFLIDSTIPNGYNVLIEGEETASELEGDTEPAFNTMFHDLLVFGAKADEYDKMKDAASQALSKKFETKFTTQMNKLRLKTTMMAYGNIIQGKHPRTASRRPTTRVVTQII